MATKRHRTEQRLLLSSYEAFRLQEIGFMMMALMRSRSRLKGNVSRTFRVSRPRPSADVQGPDSHTVANGQEVPVGQEYGDCSHGGTSKAAASRTQYLVP